MEENNVQNVDNDFLIIEKRSKLWLIPLILGFLLIIVGIIYYAVTYFSNPKYIFYKGINEIASIYQVGNTVDYNKPIRERGSLNFDFVSSDVTLQKQYDVFNNIDLLYNIDLDLKKEIMNAKISSKYDNKNLINAKFILQQNTIYLYLEGLYDKYIKEDLEVSEEDVKNNENFSKEEIDVLLDCITKSFNGVFLDDDFKREKDSIDYQSKKINVYKNSLIINENNFQRIMSGILTNLKNDENFIKTMNKIMKVDNSKEVLEDSIKEVANQKMVGTCEFVIYTKGYNNEFVKSLIILGEEESYINIDISNDGVIKFIVSGNEMPKLELMWKKTGDNSSSMNFTIEFEGEKISINLTNITETIDKVEEVDGSKAVYFDDLTDEEIEEISVKISENEGFVALMEALSQFEIDGYNPILNS